MPTRAFLGNGHRNRYCDRWEPDPADGKRLGCDGPRQPSEFDGGESFQPGKRSATAAARRGEVGLATDAASELFLSHNGGKSWKAVKRRWQGTVTQLVTLGSNNASFRLTTDSGAVWVNHDGTRWDPAIPSK